MSILSKVLKLSSIGLMVPVFLTSSLADLLHRYAFDETEGRAVSDGVSAADGEVKGEGFSWGDGQLTLDGGPSGSAAYVDLPDRMISSLPNVSFEAWVTPLGSRNWARVFDFGSSEGGALEGPGGGGQGLDYVLLSLSRGANNDQQRLEIRNNDTIGGGPDGADGPSGQQWNGDTDIVSPIGEPYHIAVTWDDETGNLNYFRDGELVQEVDTEVKLAQINDVNNWLGRSNWTADANTEGSFEEFRIYDHVLSEEEVTESLAAGPDNPPGLVDTDGDGIPDPAEERLAFLNPNNAADGEEDEDEDGLSNAREYALRTMLDVADTDGDGLTDGAEVNGDPATDPRSADSDGDTLTDGQEVNETNTNPLLADTDGDGVTDPAEVALESDPNDGASLPTAVVLNVSNSAEQDWNSSGAWSDGRAPVAGKAYAVIGGTADLLRSPAEASPAFEGDLLTVSGMGSQVIFANTGSAVIPSLRLHDARLRYTGVGAAGFNADIETSGALSVSVADGARTFEIGGSLKGEGDVTVSGFENTVRLSATNDGFNGNWVIDGTTLVAATVNGLGKGNIEVRNGGTLDLDSNLNSPQSTFTLADAESQVVFDQDFVVGAFIFGDVSLPAGTYVADDLDGLGVRDSFIGDSGSITIGGDTDADGLPDAWEMANFGGLGEGADGDSDDDGLNHSGEFDAGSDPNVADSDSDGLNDGQEIAVGSQPTIADTDGDGLSDGDEVNRAEGATSPVRADTDGDGLDDGQELADTNTDPLKVDTDDDDFSDGVEFASGTDPNNADSFPQANLSALVHRYSFSATEGTLVPDSAGTADGTVKGEGFSWGDGKLTLDGGGSGTAAYVDLPNGIISRLPGATFEAWLTPLGSQNWARVFDFGSTEGGELDGPGGGGQGQDYVILSISRGANNDQQRLDIRNNDPLGGGADGADGPNGQQWTGDTDIPSPIGQQYHIAVTWDDEAGHLNYYRDGERVQEVDTPVNLAQINDVNNWLGRSNWTGDANSHASFDEFRIYDAPLTDEDVQRSFAAGPDSGIQQLPESPLEKLVNRWSFGESDGVVVNDMVGDAHGEVKGEGFSWDSGRLRLDGGPSASAAYVDLPNGLISNKQELTIEAWLSVEGSQNWARVFDFGSSLNSEITDVGGGGEGSDYFILTAQRGGNVDQQRVEIRNNDPVGGGPDGADGPSGQQWNVDSDIVTPLGAEYHVAVTWDDATGALEYYRDGVAVGSVSTPVKMAQINDVNNWLGRSNWTGDANLQGSFNEFRIYDGVLSAEEVETSFEAGPAATIGDADSDGDGLPDALELDLFGNLDQSGAEDFDSDGLSNAAELEAGTNPKLADSDGDTLSDSVEVADGTDPLSSDSDSDGLDDAEEKAAGTNALLADSDADGFGDLAEVGSDSDPNDPASVPLPIADRAAHRYGFGELDGTLVSDAAGDASGEVKGEGFSWGAGQLVLNGGASDTAAYVDLPNGIVSSRQAITVEAWITVNGVQNWSRVFDFGSSINEEVPGPGGGGEGTDYFMLSAMRGTDLSGQRIEIRNNDPVGGGADGADGPSGQQWNGDAASPVLLGQEMHVAVTWDDASGQLAYYRDGRQFATAETPVKMAQINDVNNWLGRSNWTGDANMEGRFNEFRIFDEVLSPGEVGASFAYGPDSEGPGMSGMDSDGDGVLDSLEAIAGTDPNDATSYLRVLATEQAGDQVTLEWSSVAGKTYTIQYSLDLIEWRDIATPDVATEATSTYMDTDAARAGAVGGYYRVTVE